MKTKEQLYEEKHRLENEVQKYYEQISDVAHKIYNLEVDERMKSLDGLSVEEGDIVFGFIRNIDYHCTAIICLMIQEVSKYKDFTVRRMKYNFNDYENSTCMIQEVDMPLAQFAQYLDEYELVNLPEDICSKLLNELLSLEINVDNYDERKKYYLSERTSAKNEEE